MAPQRALDLPQLEPVAAQLDLVVEATEKLQRPVGPAPHPVTRQVDLEPTGSGGEGDEALGRQARLAEVAAGEPGPGDC